MNKSATECEHAWAYHAPRKVICPWCQLIEDTDHDCMDFEVPYTSDGALGHGWECGRCGAFIQAG